MKERQPQAAATADSFCGHCRRPFAARELKAAEYAQELCPECWERWRDDYDNP